MKLGALLIGGYIGVRGANRRADECGDECRQLMMKEPGHAFVVPAVASRDLGVADNPAA